MNLSRKNGQWQVLHLWAVFCLACVLGVAGCGPKLPADTEPKLPAAKPDAVNELKDAARMVRLGPANYERAIERLRTCVELDDKVWEAWYDLGWLALKLHRPAEAIPSLEKALSILPSHVPAVQALGEAYTLTGRAGDAAKLYAGFIERRGADPKSAPLRVQLGAALRRAGKLDEATEALRTALRQQPRSLPALNELGMVYLARENYELADLVLHRALDVDDKTLQAAETWNNLGLVALARRRDQEAFAHFDQATKLDPTLTVARRNKAVVYLDCGDYARAADELKQVTRADAGDVEAWIAYGVAERGLGNANGAAKAFEQALEIAPSSSDALYDLGVLYMDFKKEPQKAYNKLNEFLKSASDKHPKRADAQARLKELAPKVSPEPPSNPTPSTAPATKATTSGGKS